MSSTRRRSSVTTAPGRARCGSAGGPDACRRALDIRDPDVEPRVGVEGLFGVDLPAHAENFQRGPNLDPTPQGHACLVAYACQKPLDLGCLSGDLARNGR